MSGYAQQSGKSGQFNKEAITYSFFGQVLDDKGEGLPYVSVAIFQNKDSSYVKGAATYHL